MKAGKLNTEFVNFLGYSLYSNDSQRLQEIEDEFEYELSADLDDDDDEDDSLFDEYENEDDTSSL